MYQVAALWFDSTVHCDGKKKVVVFIGYRVTFRDTVGLAPFGPD